MKKSLALSRLLLDWLLICVGVLASLFCLITAFYFTVPKLLWLLVPCLALSFCLLFQGKGGKYYALGALALLLLLGFLLRRELAAGFLSLWGQLCGRYIRGYDQFRNLLPRQPIVFGEERTALIALAVLETFLVSLSVRLWKRTFPAAATLMLGIVPCFVLTDTPPALLPLMAAAFSVLTQAFSQSVRRRAAGEEDKAVVLAALLAAALLGLLLLIFPQKEYAPPISWEELSLKLENWGRKQNNRGNYDAGLSGNPEGVDLSALSALPNRPETFLYALSTQEGNFYLRGSAYSLFDGVNWTREESMNWNYKILFPDLGLRRDGLLSLETVDPETVIYTPYYTVALPANGRVVSDSYVRNGGRAQRYNLSWVWDPGPVVPDPDYESWVLENCLTLPERTREGVLAWWAAQDPVYRGIDTEEFVWQVAKTVSQCARYSRNPLRMPADRDFCTWFLEEAEEGYCVHYASACTALLRALGIPARYVSGYVCTLPANRKTPVTNLQAHAWVEAWIDGRWICVEPTPDDATEFTGDLHDAGDRPIADTEATEPAPPVTTRSSVVPTQSSRPEPSTARPTDPPAPGGNEGREGKPANLTALWVFLGLVGLLILALGRRALAAWRRERQLARAEGNEKARLLYRRLLRLSRLSTGTVPQKATALGMKAAFSQYRLQPEELDYLRELCDRQSSILAGAGFWRRLWYRYVLAVI